MAGYTGQTQFLGLAHEEPNALVCCLLFGRVYARPHHQRLVQYVVYRHVWCQRRLSLHRCDRFLHLCVLEVDEHASGQVRVDIQSTQTHVKWNVKAIDANDDDRLLPSVCWLIEDQLLCIHRSRGHRAINWRNECHNRANANTLEWCGWLTENPSL